jgi:hypothetical protein
MVLKVENQTYFHIVSTANLNPFFRFYEVYQRSYRVTQNPQGTVIEVPAMTFLRRVKEGSITTDSLPTVAFEAANHFLMLARELVWEALAQPNGVPAEYLFCCSSARNGKGPSRGRVPASLNLQGLGSIPRWLAILESCHLPPASWS